MEQLGSHWTDFIEIWYLNIIRKTDEKILFFLNKTRITGTLHKDVIVLMILSPWILFRIRNILDKICGENHNTILCSITPPPESRAVYEITWKNICSRAGLITICACALHVG